MSDCPPASGPTLAGFLDFVRSAMGIGPTLLPDSSESIADSYCVAKDIVNVAICQASPRMYALAVYNLGGSNLVNFAPDQSGQTFFADLRRAYNINSFSAGVVGAASDVSTSVTLVVPKSLEEMMLADLQYVKDPWGRQYLSISQRYGPAAWGVS